MQINPKKIIFLLAKHYGCDVTVPSQDDATNTENDLFENLKSIIDNYDNVESFTELCFDEKYFCRDEELDLTSDDEENKSPLTPKTHQRLKRQTTNESSTSYCSSSSPHHKKKRLKISDEDLQKMSIYYRATASGSRSYASMKQRFRGLIKSPDDIKKIRK
jgi:hypothetical protein